MEIRIDFSELTKLKAQYASSPDVVVQELSAAMTEADLLIEREVKERTPKAHGLLRESVIGVESINGLHVEGFVSSPLAYAVSVELGTKPHFPPIDALVDWVKVRFGVQSDKVARGIAFMIGRKIAVRGTKGAFMFERTFQAMDGQVTEIFGRAQQRIVDRLAGV